MFLEHFSVLNSTEERNEAESEDNVNETQRSSCVTNEYSKTPNSPISEAEVNKAVKQLKNGKACGEDNILNEMIQKFSENHLHMLKNIYIILY